MWFNRFRIYLLMPKPRSLLGSYKLEDAAEVEGDNTGTDRVGRIKRLKKPPKSAPAAWKNAMTSFHWQLRARAYDRYKTRLEEQNIREWEIELRKKMQAAAEDNFRLADEMAKRSLEIKTKVTDTGTVLEMPAHWTARDIAAFRLAGAELGTKAVKRPDVDLIHAVELLVAEGILDSEILDAAEQGYDSLREAVRDAVSRSKGDGADNSLGDDGDGS